jgi:hypothetical protein
MAKFNAGDIIVAKETDPSNYITAGKHYTVIRQRGDLLDIVNNSGSR